MSSNQNTKINMKSEMQPSFSATALSEANAGLLCEVRDGEALSFGGQDVDLR